MESLSVDIIPAGEPEDTAGAAFPGPDVGGDADAAAHGIGCLFKEAVGSLRRMVDGQDFKEAVQCSFRI